MTALRTVKPIIVALIGGTVLLVSLALIVRPGPAFLVIPAALAVVAILHDGGRCWLPQAASNGSLPMNHLLQTARVAVTATGRTAPLDRCM